jgi:hypothetical protein
VKKKIANVTLPLRALRFLHGRYKLVKLKKRYGDGEGPGEKDL